MQQAFKRDVSGGDVTHATEALGVLSRPFRKGGKSKVSASPDIKYPDQPSRMGTEGVTGRTNVSEDVGCVKVVSKSVNATKCTSVHCRATSS
jgi:hypothetical protein